MQLELYNNAMQTFEYWGCHICLWIVSLVMHKSFIYTRSLEALTCFFFFFVWLWLVCVWRVRPVNEIKRKWLANVFSYRKDKTWVMIVFLFFFFCRHCFKNQAYLLKAFIEYKDKLSGHFLCAKIFWGKFPSPPPTKISLLWQFPFPCYIDIYWHPLCNILHMLRSEKQTCSHTIVIIYIKKKDK